MSQTTTSGTLCRSEARASAALEARVTEKPPFSRARAAISRIARSSSTTSARVICPIMPPQPPSAACGHGRRFRRPRARQARGLRPPARPRSPVRLSGAPRTGLSPCENFRAFPTRLSTTLSRSRASPRTETPGSTPPETRPRAPSSSMRAETRPERSTGRASLSNGFRRRRSRSRRASTIPARRPVSATTSPETRDLSSVDRSKPARSCARPRTDVSGVFSSWATTLRASASSLLSSAIAAARDSSSATRAVAPAASRAFRRPSPIDVSTTAAATGRTEAANVRPRSGRVPGRSAANAIRPARAPASSGGRTRRRSPARKASVAAARTLTPGTGEPQGVTGSTIRSPIPATLAPTKTRRPERSGPSSSRRRHAGSDGTSTGLAA